MYCRFKEWLAWNGKALDWCRNWKAIKSWNSRFASQRKRERESCEISASSLASKWLWPSPKEEWEGWKSEPFPRFFFLLLLSTVSFIRVGSTYDTRAGHQSKTHRHDMCVEECQRGWSLGHSQRWPLPRDRRTFGHSRLSRCWVFLGIHSFYLKDEERSKSKRE